MQYAFKLFAVCATALLAIGCASTKGAYQAADTPDEYAYVVAEHYNALVNQAADLKDEGVLNESQIAALQAADRIAKPLVLKLRELAANYAAVKSAGNQAALQKALNDAVLAVADFVRALKVARAVATTMIEPMAAGGVS